MSRVRAGGGRQLSGKEGGSEDDPEIDAIVELCLELEQDYARSLQPSEMPQQMHWGDSQPWQHVSGSREELHTGAQTPLNAPLVFDKFNQGLVLLQAQPRAQPGAPVHDVQPSIQRSTFPSIVGALSAGKRKREDYPTTYPLNPPKRYMSPSEQSTRAPRTHETSARKPSKSSKDAQLLESEWRIMTQGLLNALGVTDPESRPSGSTSSSPCASPVPSTSEEASNAALASGMQKPSSPSSGSPGSPLNTNEPIAAPDDNPTPEPVASTTSPKPASPAREHPFYRIPVLQPVLVQDMVRQVDLEGLLCKMETLAGYLMHSHTKRAVQLVPQKAVRALGLRYMILDALFVAREVLGEAGNSNSWWEELVANIPEEVADKPYNRSFGDQFEVNIRLRKALCAAIQLLKKGIRPNRETTILLKRQLLCKETMTGHIAATAVDSEIP
ncbi:LOW QUALITY PROTEIN: uncharacterized protein EMH_0083530 [Eimeria mitis]|uniref:Uncharacterized protein n=1 Tax=Eimeria mitis TaxID=44415 RepID=U6KBD6_9EIME|nr:LOW QUALITY PROTEIN: uncharacterized protein EMH_0083530 [Eimeria mitis]CDJ33537.1 hypothetical protein EMH_0083530 [Eimeria mitis]